MPRVSQVKILRYNTHELKECEKEMNELFASGWMPYGNPMIDTNHVMQSSYYIQTLIKPTFDEPADIHIPT